MDRGQDRADRPCPAERSRALGMPAYSTFMTLVAAFISRLLNGVKFTLDSLSLTLLSCQGRSRSWEDRKVVTRLDRLTVVETALRLLNETGLDGLSLRRIAAELDVKAPALYWHFDSKQALLDEMATEILRGIARAVEATGDHEGLLDAEVSWQELMTESMRALRRVLLGYRDGAKVFSGRTFTGTDYAAPLQGSLEPLMQQGFTLGSAGRAWATIYSYTIGFVIEEQVVYPVPGQRDPRYDLAERTERLAPDYPIAAEVGEEIFGDYDEGFEAGLAVVIAGIEARLAPTEQPAK
jgi:TetR/AcrR family transcriptional regulator, tetracycline repressor protein